MTQLKQKIVHWFCDKIWTKFDPQPQYLHIQLDITNTCNLRCDHCYCPHHKNEGALTYNQWLQVLDQYEELLSKLCMLPRVTLCGGEPLLAPFWFELLKNIRHRFPECDLSVQSNGTIITAAMAEKFKSLNVNLQISIDGPDAPRHNRIRGQGTFEKTIAGCQLLKEYGVPFHHQAVLSRRTVGWIPEFFNLPAVTGASALNFTRFIPEGYGQRLYADGEDQPLEGAALRKAYETILHSSRRTAIRTATSGALWHLIEEGLGSPNNVGFNGFVIGYRGEFKVTSRTPLSLGNVLEKEMENLFLQHPIMKQLREGKIDVCGDCKYFEKCRGDRNVSFAQFGNFFGPDTGCWIINKNEGGIYEKNY